MVEIEGCLGLALHVRPIALTNCPALETLDEAAIQARLSAKHGLLRSEWVAARCCHPQGTAPTGRDRDIAAGGIRRGARRRTTLPPLTLCGVISTGAMRRAGNVRFGEGIGSASVYSSMMPRCPICPPGGE